MENIRMIALTQGQFTIVEAASECYKKAAQERFGEYAYVEQ